MASSCLPEQTGAVWSAEEQRIRAAYDRRPRDSSRYAWTSPGHLFDQQERERQALRTLGRAELVPLATRDILEVGCGSGAWLGALLRWGADPRRLRGMDLLDEPLARARRRVPQAVRLERASAAHLPYPDGCFDIVLQATALSSMLEASLRRRAAEEMQRVLKPGGVILWYDFHVSNPRNRDVIGIGRREIAALFPGCGVTLRRTGLAPPLMRPAARWSWLLAYLLARVPLLCTHYMGIIRPQA